MTEGPYSRVYWAVLDDKKFDAIRADMRHFGSWTLMLVVADMAYPAPAFIPPSIPKASLAALVDAKLIELLPARMYRVKGLKSERESRSERGKAGAAARWSGNATAMRPQSERNATAMLDETSIEETRQDEATDEHSAPAGLSSEEAHIFSRIAKAGAFIRPETGMGIRVVGLIARRGPIAVSSELDRLTANGPLSDRQIVFGLEEALDKIPAASDARVAEVESLNAKKGEAIYDRMVSRRLEYLRNTGLWPEDWGPKPVEVTA